MGEIKQANFRLDTDTTKAFRDFCDQQGFNQAEGFNYLLKTLELDQAKNQLSERQTEIKQFEQSIKTLQTLYLSSLELNANAEVRVKEQFSTDLIRKDKTIDELREKISFIENQKETAELAAKEALSLKAAAEEKQKNAEEKLEAAQKNASDTERLNIMLSAQLAEAEEKLNNYNMLEKSEQENATVIQKLNQTIEVLKKDHAMELELLKKDHAAEVKLLQKDAELSVERAIQSERSRADKIEGQLQELKNQRKSITVGGNFHHSDS